MFAKEPSRKFQLGETLPAIPVPYKPWPWGRTPSLEAWSVSMWQKYPLGTIIYDVVDGYPVVAQIQTHDSYGAHTNWAPKPHKGTSVFVPVARDSTTGRTTAVRDVPDGWGDPSTMAGELPGVWEARKRTWLLPIGGVITGAFIAGPGGAIVGGLAGYVLNKTAWLKQVVMRRRVIPGMPPRRAPRPPV